MRYLFSLQLIIIFICCNKQDKKISSALIENGASISVIGDETLDFGQIVEGEKVDLEFSLKNSGTGDLIISKINASCGCTQIEYPKDIIKISDTFKIKITFDSEDRLGKQTKKITIVSNATPNVKILTIKGTILPFQN
tara:strand:+ start:350 stop:763 length:414 start_codon:yes stop_codon:yes gene_type:complete